MNDWLSNRTVLSHLKNDVEIWYINYKGIKVNNIEWSQGDLIDLQTAIMEAIDNALHVSNYQKAKIGNTISPNTLQEIFIYDTYEVDEGKKLNRKRYLTLSRLCMAIGFQDWHGYKAKSFENEDDKELIKGEVYSQFKSEWTVAQQLFEDSFEPEEYEKYAPLFYEYILSSLYRVIMDRPDTPGDNSLIKNIGTASTISIHDVQIYFVNSHMTPIRLTLLFDLVLYTNPDSRDKILVPVDDGDGNIVLDTDWKKSKGLPKQIQYLQELVSVHLFASKEFRTGKWSLLNYSIAPIITRIISLKTKDISG